MYHLIKEEMVVNISIMVYNSINIQKNSIRKQKVLTEPKMTRIRIIMNIDNVICILMKKKMH